MDLRITSQALVQQTIANVRRHFDKLANLQVQASTGKRLLKPSDAPTEHIVLMTSRAQETRVETYLNNIRDARTLLDVSVSALREASNALSGARQIAIEGTHGAHDATSFEALAQQVDALIRRMLDVSNTDHNDTFLYGGTQSGQAPFSVSSVDSQGRPQTVTYSGSSDTGFVTINRQGFVPTLYPGSQVFQPRDRMTTLYFGNTGATAGTGTDNATGQGTLTVRHTTTSYAAGSGVSAGTGSGLNDTIIGPAGAHRLTVIDTSGTGTFGTVSLNGGPAIPFSNTDTNLKVSGINGEVVFIDTTSVTPGFNGDVAITADGTLSVDNGASETPINFSANQVVTHSQNGTVTNVNSSNIRRIGVDHLEYAGTFDAFQILMALRDDLRNVRGLTARDQADSISRRISELDRVREGILEVVGEQSADLDNLQSLENRLQDLRLESQKQASEIESADISQVVIQLQEQQNLLQLTFASSARIFDLSLLDFLG